MRKGILAIAAAGSVFALTAAGAAGLGTVTSDPVSTLKASGVVNTIAVNACRDTYTINYKYNLDHTAIVGVGATDTVYVAGEPGTPAGEFCTNVGYKVDVLVGTTHYLVNGTTDVATGSAALKDFESGSIDAVATSITSATVTIGS